MADRAADPAERRLVEIVRASPLLMRALRVARAVNPPDWLIGAGAIRDVVWDHLHGCSRATRVKDVDLAFFDPIALEPERERQVEAALRAGAPDIPWDAKNQAAVHLWYEEAFGVAVEPVTSSADAVATWPETATSIGLRLLDDERIEVEAPFGLDDLFGLVWRRNPRRVTVEEYRRRLLTKRVRSRWPRVAVADLSE